MKNRSDPYYTPKGSSLKKALAAANAIAASFKTTPKEPALNPTVTIFPPKPHGKSK